MCKSLVISCLLASVIVALSFIQKENLREIYSRPPAQWPRPTIDPGVKWKELGMLPASPINADSLKHLIALGKKLFFDPRLSGSGNIACATCHRPELSWTDGKSRSVGHEGQSNKRNSPSIQNVWFYSSLFWDGRSHSLEDQAFAPINSESEMHGDMQTLPENLKKIKGYVPLFDSAFGDAAIDPDRITGAIAAFERSIVSRRSRFDEFLSGNKYALTETELHGLHLFRTKARCMNCHNGQLLTDNSFHNNGFAQEDKGRYSVTHKDDDLGKFKTPSLRDVVFTKPYMHDGSMISLAGIIKRYDQVQPGVKDLDALLRPLKLTKQEKSDLLAFLQAISAPPLLFDKPNLP